MYLFIFTHIHTVVFPIISKFESQECPQCGELQHHLHRADGLSRWLAACSAALDFGGAPAAGE